MTLRHNESPETKKVISRRLRSLKNYEAVKYIHWRRAVNANLIAQLCKSTCNNKLQFPYIFVIRETCLKYGR